MARFESIDAFVAAIPAMAARSRDLLRGHDGLFRLDTRQGRTFFMRLSDGEMTLPENPPDNTDCRVTADEADLLRIVNGSLSPVTALLFGKVRVSGDKSKLLALAKLMK